MTEFQAVLLLSINGLSVVIAICVSLIVRVLKKIENNVECLHYDALDTHTLLHRMTP